MGPALAPLIPVTMCRLSANLETKKRAAGQPPSPDDDGFRLAAGKHTFSATVLSGRTEPPASALNDPQIAWAQECSNRERKKLAERELKLPAEEATSAMKVITVRQC